MPTFELAISAVDSLTNFAKIKDETADYPNRALVGNYLLVYKMDSDSLQDLDVTPVQNSDFLTILEWQFTTAQDGWYQFTLLSVPIWDISTAYTKETAVGANDESIVYYDTTKKFYRCILDDTGTAPDDPGGTLVWSEITDMNEIVNNSTIDTHIHDDGISSKHEKVFNEQVDKAVQDTFCKDCDEFKEIEKYARIGVLLDGFYSLNFVDRSAEMEEIARYVEDTYINK